MRFKDLLSNNLNGMLLRSWSRLPVIIDDFILRDSNGDVIYDTNGNCFTIGEIPSNVLLDEYGEVILDANGDYFTVNYPSTAILINGTPLLVNGDFVNNIGA